MAEDRCRRCDTPISDASRRRGRCESCNAPVAMLVVPPSEAGAAPKGPAPFVAEGDADPNAMTLADMTYEDMKRAAAATLALDPDDAPDDPAPPASEAATLAYDPGAATLALDTDAPPPASARSEAATLAYDPGAATLALDPDAPAPAATTGARAQAAQTHSPDAPEAAATGALRRYKDGAFVTMAGESVRASAERVDVFELPYGSDDVITRIGGYDVLGELGRGGMGVVYRAYSLRLCRVVALKMMTSGRHASEAELVRFQNEAMLAARLAHPHIVPVFDAGEHEGNFYFVMAFVEGTGFGDIIADRTDEGLRRGVRALAKVCRALDYAHRKGIVHRDIKPDNVIIDGDDEPHITDFGIAKNVDRAVSITKQGAMLGTPAYMAPEQANAELTRIGPLTDVYSTGATLYHLLTGRAPFSGPTPLAVLISVLESDPDAPRAAARKAGGRKVDEDLETICLKAMEKRADQRYDSARAMAEDLEAWLDDRPIAARPIGAAERLRKLVRRNRAAFVTLLAVFSTLMFIAVGFGVVMAFNISRTSDSLRDADTRAGVDQARTLERAIIVNMSLGRPDVVRQLVNELRKDATISSVDVVRPNKTLAYRDLSTLNAVRSFMESGAWGTHMASRQAMKPAVATAKEAAFERIAASETATEGAETFAFDDAAWREVLASKTPVVRTEEIGGVPFLTVMKPIANGPACQTCHGSVVAADAPAGGGGAYDYGGGGGGYDYGDSGGGYDYGDADASAERFDPRNEVRAVLVVRRSQAAVEEQISDNTRSTLMVAGGTAGGFVLLIFVFIKLFGVRLRPQRFG